ncbi:hypothetical protein H4R20_003540 [Coemansia guatemalensis]|uniref:Protein kinase domain-containing protein n=1 Tax=Coemansia guatemalensis TaxID=2761395 RepID=A0A9W8HTI8_9FUNG|nr:hypothetical protein H4R20_003540 [Coemansia guatemalensis]
MSNTGTNPESLAIDDLQISQIVTPSKSSSSKQSGQFKNIPATPSRLRETAVSTTGDAADNNPELEERRKVIGKSVVARLLKDKPFKSIMNQLQLGAQYDSFRDASGDIFLDIARRSLVFSHGKFKRAESQGPYQDKESALVSHFIDIHQEICNIADQNLKGTSYQTSPYTFHDAQNCTMAGSNIRPDGVFGFGKSLRSFSTVHIVLEAKRTSYAADIPNNVLGQLGDYALAVWREQPLRKFVPVLFLHGKMLDLFIFTRGNVYRGDMGYIGYAGGSTLNKQATSDIAEAYRDLWFLLTLPTEKFGHICHLENASYGIKVLSDNSSTRMNVEESSENSRNVVSFEDRIHKTVHIFGRLAYLYRSSYQGKPVVVKISWSPVDRLPECAMYEALQAAGVPGVPNVISHGFISDDLFGYRVELLLLEDCGIPIGAYFAESGSDTKSRSEREGELAEYTKQIATTLVRAYDSGILHRDISYGNITIKNKRAYLIDWGYAKFLPWAHTGELAQRWGFGDTNVTQNENEHDSITGTPLFMSVQILLGATERSIMHDLESLFMVMLHSLASINGRVPDSDDPKYGWKFLGSDMTATLRLGCLCCPQKYLEKFGCGDCGQVVKSVADSMYRLLFTEDDIFLGGKLILDKNYKRRFDSAAAAVFMGDDPSRLLQIHLDSPEEPDIEVQEIANEYTVQTAANHQQRHVSALPVPVAAAKSNVPATQTKPPRNLHIRNAPRVRSDAALNKDRMGITGRRVAPALADTVTQGQTAQVARPGSGISNRGAFARLARPTEASTRRAANRSVVNRTASRAASRADSSPRQQQPQLPIPDDEIGGFARERNRKDHRFK